MPSSAVLDARSGESEALILEVSAEQAGVRLDRFVVLAKPELSRSRAQALIEAGCVHRLGHTGDEGEPLGEASRKVKLGERFALVVPQAIAAEPQGEAMQLVIAYEDEHLLVVDKPAGLVVHPGAGHATSTLVNALIGHCGDSLSGIGGVKRPGIVHRLDKDTSGLLVVAKTDAAHRGLSEQFAAHGRDGRLQRQYVALVWGGLSPATGRIETEIGRSTRNRLRMSVVAAGRGRTAATRYTVRGVACDSAGRPLASLIQLELETGRTHQIRVHMAHLGHPILGDATYASSHSASARRLDTRAQAALKALGRQALHAAVLGFQHPVTGKKLSFQSELPVDLSNLVRALGLAPKAVKPSKAKRVSR